jgi:hypothetical protein
MLTLGAYYAVLSDAPMWECTSGMAIIAVLLGMVIYVKGGASGPASSLNVWFPSGPMPVGECEGWLREL